MPSPLSAVIEDIRALLPTPASPVGLVRPWQEVEQQLGVLLPTDYKQFIDLYGSGVVCGSVTVWNFRDTSLFKKPLQDGLCGKGSVIRLYERAGLEARCHWPYPTYPEPGGLLPFATVLDIHNLNWLTTGAPDQWEVVYWFFDGLEFI